MAGPNPLKDPAAGAVPAQGEATDATVSRTRIVSRPSLRAAPSATTRSDREAASILLVDDDPAVLRAVGRSLRSPATIAELNLALLTRTY